MSRIARLFSAALVVVLLTAASALADNEGFFKSPAWTGIAIEQSDYRDDPNTRSWYGFANWNVLNGEGGNLFIGAGIGLSDYVYDRTRQGYQGGGHISTDAELMPVELNIGWASASDVFNVWFGAGVSTNYTESTTEWTKTVTDGTNTGTCTARTTNDATWQSGTQTFAGMEWLPKRWGRKVGIWIQLKQRSIEPTKGKFGQTVTCDGVPSDFSHTFQDFDENIDYSATVQSLGISYHF